MYCGDILLKKLKMFRYIHCATLSLLGSQFILINSFIPTLALLSRFKQYLIHSFCDVWISFDSLLFKRDTKQNRHSHSVAESKNCTVNDVKGVLKIFVSSKEILICY